ncbi:MAG: DNA-binding protein [Firmicutes bacterium]|nr:DNA-binding protein [Bacillota bacterium]
MLKNNLKSWRHKREMNQTEFAMFLGVNKNQYSRWERQEIQPSLEWAWNISRKLQCHIEELIDPPD